MTKKALPKTNFYLDEELIRVVVEEAANPIFVKDRNGRYLLINKAGASWFGLTPEDVIGKTDSDLFDRKTANIIMESDREVMAADKAVTYERTAGFGDQTRTYFTTKTPYHDKNGEVAGLIGISRDFTQGKEIENAKDNFLAMLAHELRNPLAPIHNAVEIIKLQQLEDETTKNLFNVIGRQVKNMARLLDDLLDVSRLTRGKIALQKEYIDLATIVLRSVETARPFMESRRHAFSLSLPSEPVELHADSVRLEQILVNLLNNATKFTERGGKIALSAQCDGRDVVFKVKDSGKGIPPEVADKIFELFFQEDQTLVRTERGLGVGLTIVKTLVEIHGGSVSAHSGGIGKGCEFIVRLPIVEERAQSVAVAPDFYRTSHSEGKKKILIVDDNLDAAASLGELLRRWGYDVRTVNDGPAVLREVPEWQPSIILLDIGLPEMDGYEVAQELKRRLSDLCPLIVAVTGYGQEDDKRKAEAVGFDHYFTKPLDFAALKQILTK